jgi:hypothetical protein
MKDSNVFERVAIGAAAGMAGTVALQAIRTASQKALPEASPPIRQDPGEFMVEKAKGLLPEPTREQIPEPAEKAAGQALGMGYGLTFGAIYSALRPDGGNLMVDGPALGLGAWAVGYLGWLPSLGLMPPITEHEPKQVAVPILQHLLYGVATVAAYQGIHDRL